MAQLIDQILNSGLFAQSAYSASIATKDNLGRDITATYLTGVSIPESATWNDVASTYQTNSSTYITAHQSLDGYATTSELNSTSSYLSGAIDYVSANAGSNVSSYPYIVSSKSLSGPASAFIPNPVINFSGAGSWPGLTRYPVKITLSSDGQEKECGWLAPASTASQIGNSNIFLGWSTMWKSPGWQTLDVYQKNETSGADELANAFANIPAGDIEVNTYVQSNSSKIDDVNTSYQTNSGTIDNTINNVQTNSSVWDNVTGKQDSLNFHYLEI